MSRYSQGVLARKLVKTSCQSGRVAPGFDDVVGRRLQGLEAGVAAVFDHQLESAGRSQAVDGGRAEDIDQSLLDLAAEGRLQPTGDDAVREPLSHARVKIVEHQIHRAEVRRVRVEQNRLAGNRHRVLDARRVAGNFLDSLHDLLRALHGSRIGQLDIDHQVALVLRRNESFRRRLKAAVGQNQQAAVNQQHDHADAKQSADRAGVDGGRAVEAPVERAKRPGEQPVERPTDQRPKAIPAAIATASGSQFSDMSPQPNRVARSQPKSPPISGKPNHGSGRAVSLS